MFCFFVMQVKIYAMETQQKMSSYVERITKKNMVGNES